MDLILRIAAIILLTLMYAALSFSLYSTGLVSVAWGLVITVSFVLIVGSAIAADWNK